MIDLDDLRQALKNIETKWSMCDDEVLVDAAREFLRLKETGDSIQKENALLRELLKEQWEYNHAEHCGSDWPHPAGRVCYWPLPTILGPDGASSDYPAESSDLRLPARERLKETGEKVWFCLAHGSKEFDTGKRPPQFCVIAYLLDKDAQPCRMVEALLTVRDGE